MQLKSGGWLETVGQCTWNVTDKSFWQPCIGQRIMEVALIWAMLPTAAPQEDAPEELPYVQTIRLFFANGKTVFISAAELSTYGQGKAVLGTNNLLVTDDEAIASACALFQHGRFFIES